MMKKLVATKESPYHGLNLCVGTIAEMLEKPLLGMQLALEPAEGRAFR